MEEEIFTNDYWHAAGWRWWANGNPVKLAEENQRRYEAALIENAREVVRIDFHRRISEMQREAASNLPQRTIERMRRGVEGTHTV